MSAVTSDIEKVQHLFQEGLYEDALEGLLRSRQATESEFGPSPYWLAHGLGVWCSLAEVYEPAKVSLERLRNSLCIALKEPNSDSVKFLEVFAIDVARKQERCSRLLFLELHEMKATIAPDCYRVVEDLLVEEEDYDVCFEYVSNPSKRLSYLREIYEDQLRLAADYKIAHTEEVQSSAIEAYTKGVYNLLQILVAVGRENEAREVKEEALRNLDSKAIRDFPI